MMGWLRTLTRLMHIPSPMQSDTKVSLWIVCKHKTSRSRLPCFVCACFGNTGNINVEYIKYWILFWTAGHCTGGGLHPPYTLIPKGQQTVADHTFTFPPSLACFRREGRGVLGHNNVEIEFDTKTNSSKINPEKCKCKLRQFTLT